MLQGQANRLRRALASRSVRLIERARNTAVSLQTRWVEPKRAWIRNHEIGDLIFGGLNPQQQDFFTHLHEKRNRIELRDLPHYHYWRDGESARPEEGDFYRYLSVSWRHHRPDSNSHEERISYLAQYEGLRDDIRARGVREPIRVFMAPDGRRIVLDGIQRASIAYALGIDLPCVVVPLRSAIRELVRNDSETWGTGRKSRPYQSIYVGDRPLIPGRRLDTLERFRKISVLEDVRGKSVLDLGCNVGMDAILAWQHGARRVAGVENSPRIAASALRLSTVFATPLAMIVHDLASPLIGAGVYDTVFCFSVHALTRDGRALEDTIRAVTGSTLYFEGQEMGTREDYAHIFRHFRAVEFLGYNSDGIHRRTATRPFFRCVR